MSKLSEFKDLLSPKTPAVKPVKEEPQKQENPKKKIDKNIWWEISAYIVRGLSVGVPAAIIMTLENSWVKSGIGLTLTIVLVALAIIYKEPIKKAAGYAPGVIPFTIFVIIALFFNTTANALLTVGLSGLGGSIIAVPLHYKYLKAKENTDSKELSVLKDIAEALKKQ